MSHALPPVDAVLLLSFGGPEGPDDVVPFLENVTRGRSIPRERLEEVGKHYSDFAHRLRNRIPEEKRLRVSGRVLTAFLPWRHTNEGIGLSAAYEGSSAEWR